MYALLPLSPYVCHVHALAAIRKLPQSSRLLKTRCGLGRPSMRAAFLVVVLYLPSRSTPGPSSKEALFCDTPMNA